MKLRPTLAASVLLVLLLGTMVVAPASTDAQNIPTVQYTVRAGETLNKIARRFCTTWKEIYRLNKGTIGPNPNYVQEGSVLHIIPRCGAAPPPSSSGRGTYDRGPRLHAQGSLRGNVYTVAWGDMLYAVSQRFGVSQRTLMRVNSIANPNRIYQGQKLVIPGLGRAKPAKKPTPPATTVPIAGTRWQATAYHDGSSMTPVLPGSVVTSQFGKKGRLTGTAGCNSYQTNYLADDHFVAIYPAAVTRMMCGEPAGIMEQESGFLAALAAAGAYYREGGQLFLQDVNGLVLVHYVSY